MRTPVFCLPRLRFPFLLLSFALFGSSAPINLWASDSQTAPAGPAVDPRITSVVSLLEKTRAIHQAALSPDGQWLAWAVASGEQTEIQVAPASDPSHSRRI